MRSACFRITSSYHLQKSLNESGDEEGIKRIKTSPRQKFVSRFPHDLGTTLRALNRIFMSVAVIQRYSAIYILSSRKENLSEITPQGKIIFGNGEKSKATQAKLRLMTGHWQTAKTCRFVGASASPVEQATGNDISLSIFWLTIYELGAELNELHPAGQQNGKRHK